MCNEVLEKLTKLYGPMLVTESSECQKLQGADLQTEWSFCGRNVLIGGIWEIRDRWRDLGNQGPLTRFGKSGTAEAELTAQVLTLTLRSLIPGWQNLASNV